MDRREKKRIRDFIGEYLDVSNTRLTDEEASQLNELIGNYDSTYKGKADSRSRTFETKAFASRLPSPWHLPEQRRWPQSRSALEPLEPAAMKSRNVAGSSMAAKPEFAA